MMLFIKLYDSMKYMVRVFLAKIWVVNQSDNRQNQKKIIF
jgi:hypothetical protein